MYDLNKEELELMKSKASMYAVGGINQEKHLWVNILLKLNIAANNIDSTKTINNADSFNNSNLAQLRNYIENSCEDLKKSGIGIKIGSFNYSPTTATATLEAYTLSDPGDTDALLRAKFEKELFRYQLRGFTSAHFLKEFNYKGRVYQFLGFLPKGKKFIYLARMKGQSLQTKFTNSIESQLL